MQSFFRLKIRKLFQIKSIEGLKFLKFEFQPKKIVLKKVKLQKLRDTWYIFTRHKEIKANNWNRLKISWTIKYNGLFALSCNRNFEKSDFKFKKFEKKYCIWRSWKWI